jgi:hypothetical protein
MLEWCAQIVHAGSYYTYSHVGHVGGVLGARTAFILLFRFQQDILAKQPNVSENGARGGLPPGGLSLFQSLEGRAPIININL